MNMMTMILTMLVVMLPTISIYVCGNRLQPSHPVKTLQHAVNMLQNDGIKGNSEL